MFILPLAVNFFNNFTNTIVNVWRFLEVETYCLETVKIDFSIFSIKSNVSMFLSKPHFGFLIYCSKCYNKFL